MPTKLQEELTRILGSNSQACNRIDQAKDKMRCGEVPDVNHCPAQSVFHNTISHAYDEKKEKGERISTSI
jgi:hypothetical protein